MRGAFRQGPAVLVLLCSPLAALAQPAPQPCPALVAPSGALAAWTAPIDRAAASDAHHLASAEIPVGQALRLALLPDSGVDYPVHPGKVSATGSHGGLLGLTIGETGTYRIALGSAAWIDLASNGTAVASSAHAHAPACSGIHKMVDFPLPAGHYILELSANAEPQTTVLVVRLP